MPITLYDAPRCPFCARTRIVLAEKVLFPALFVRGPGRRLLAEEGQLGSSTSLRARGGSRSSNCIS